MWRDDERIDAMTMAEPTGCPSCGEKWFNCGCKKARKSQKVTQPARTLGSTAKRVALRRPMTVGELRRMLEPYMDEMPIVWNDFACDEPVFYSLANNKAKLEL